MPYNSKVAKAVYYKQNITNFKQLFDSIIRLQFDMRTSGETKAKIIEKMFNSYLHHSQAHKHII